MLPFAVLQAEVGKGAFQELDQLAAAALHVKWAGRAAQLADIPRLVAQAFQVRGCEAACIGGSRGRVAAGGSACAEVGGGMLELGWWHAAAEPGILPLLPGLQAAASSRPGAAYVDIPSNLLFGERGRGGWARAT